jgi:hypothetical protein
MEDADPAFGMLYFCDNSHKILDKKKAAQGSLLK